MTLIDDIRARSEARHHFCGSLDGHVCYLFGEGERWAVAYELPGGEVKISPVQTHASAVVHFRRAVSEMRRVQENAERQIGVPA